MYFINRPAKPNAYTPEMIERLFRELGMQAVAKHPPGELVEDHQSVADGGEKERK
jgi:hypothetical protein